MTPPIQDKTHGAIKSAPNWLGFAPAIFVLLWATGFIGSRLSTPYAEPLSFLTIRFGIAAMLLVAVALVMRASWPDRRTTVQCLITGALIHGGYLGFVFWAIWKGMPTGVCALIVGLQPLMTAMLAGMGRALAEVGAVMIVGGNIDHVTRVMTTAIALETSKGDLALALGLGIILMVLALIVNGALMALRGSAKRLAYA